MSTNQLSPSALSRFAKRELAGWLVSYLVSDTDAIGYKITVMCHPDFFCSDVDDVVVVSVVIAWNKLPQVLQRLGETSGALRLMSVQTVYPQVVWR